MRGYRRYIKDRECFYLLMAYRNDSRRSSISNADSGISSTNSTRNIHSRYACYWVENQCKGNHELDLCPVRRQQLSGKLGIYYSSNGIFRRFMVDEINRKSLRYNPTGCTMVNLLIYKHENDQIYLLFAMKNLLDKSQESNGHTERRLLLGLPTSYPCRKDEMQKQVAVKALETITNVNEITANARGKLRSFLFVNAAAIYPLQLSVDQAKLLTDRFSPNEDVTSLHWLSLSTVVHQLPTMNNYLSRREEGNELAQTHDVSFPNITFNHGNEQLTMWSVLVQYLVYARHHVGFETFLRI